ncbi:DUF2975 domain-containing protein [Methylosinus sp. H3A]|uniref:DUF2975 domain-containing protein n=1 Tax=Methylosinus sp. H3A TaxID=2785786 RepID=UPI0018C2808E|nr:DUF2975 domain-containing protein [Methylosinus sp. H3A]MBG0810469.1 DUF2975 domain-containing protein [Methylosinus sp. H3A]
MTNILLFDTPEPAPVETPLRRRLRRNSELLCALFSALLATAALFAIALVAAVLFYQGEFVSFGPGGLWFGRGPDAAAGRVALSSFGAPQRLAGAFALTLLVAPAAYIFLRLRMLFRLYARGVVFSPRNALCLRHVGLGLLAYAFAPFCANRIALLAGVGNDPSWFHLYEIQAAILGALVFVIADVMRCAHEIEAERDGFV